MNKKWIVITYLLVITAGALLFFLFGKESAIHAVESLKSMGPAGAVLFTAVFIAGSLVFFPLTWLALCAGVLYGLFYGFILAWLSSVLAAVIGFLLSRFLCRGWMEKKMAGSEKFRAFCENVSNHGWKIIAVSRFSLVLPYAAMNYAFGMTTTPFWQYTLVTFFAMIPSTLLYVSAGSAAGSIAAYFHGQKTMTPAEIILIVIGLLASAGLVIYFGMLANKINSGGKKASA